MSRDGCGSLCGVLALIAALSAPATAGFFEKRYVLVTKFRYQPCDYLSSAGLPTSLEDFDVLTTIYGDLDLLGTLFTAVNLTAPIKASVSMRRYILGLYVPIPCIRSFGSCVYRDVCKYGYPEGEDCPPIFEEHDLPCRCPIKAGVYSLPGGQFHVDKTRWAGILAGKYKGLVKFYDKKEMVGCYKFYYTLE